MSCRLQASCGGRLGRRYLWWQDRYRHGVGDREDSTWLLWLHGGFCVVCGGDTCSSGPFFLILFLTDEVSLFHGTVHEAFNGGGVRRHVLDRVAV